MENIDGTLKVWHVWGMPKPSSKRLKRPSDPIQLAKLIGDIATGQVEDKPAIPPTPDEIRRVMSALGRTGGLKGGKARAASLSPTKRVEIAKKAALARWKAKR